MLIYDFIDDKLKRGEKLNTDKWCDHMLQDVYIDGSSPTQFRNTYPAISYETFSKLVQNRSNRIDKKV